MRKVKFAKVKKQKIKKAKLPRLRFEKDIRRRLETSAKPVSMIDKERFEAMKEERRYKNILYNSRRDMQKLGLHPDLLNDYFSLEKLQTFEFRNVLEMKSRREVMAYRNKLMSSKKEFSKEMSGFKKTIRNTKRWTDTIENVMNYKSNDANKIIDRFIDNVDSETRMNVDVAATKRPQANVSTLHGTFPLPYIDKYKDRKAFEKEVTRWSERNWDPSLKENRFRESLRTARDSILEIATKDERDKINVLYSEALSLTDEELTAFSRLNVYNSVNILTSSSVEQVITNFEKIMSVISRLKEASVQEGLRTKEED